MYAWLSHSSERHFIAHTHPFPFPRSIFSADELSQTPFRQLSVVPTVAEMNDALHRGRQRLCGVPSNVPRLPLDQSAEELLEGQFRLLRYDMLGSAFEQLNERNPRRQQLQRIHDTLYRVKPLQPNHQRGAEIQFSFSLHQEHPAFRQKRSAVGKLLKEERAFKRGSLFMLRRGDDIVHIARVAATEEKDLESGLVNLVMGDAPSLNNILKEPTDVKATGRRGHTLSRVADAEAQKATCAPDAAAPSRNTRGATYTAIAFASSFFSYEPVLQRLQDMERVPFAEELLHSDQATSMPNVTYWADQNFMHEAVESCIREKKLNPSQAKALGRSARKRVSLIQGPPGTGKTYVGTALAEVILRKGRQKILVCFSKVRSTLDLLAMSIF